jgi:hypothetical protein
MVEMATQLLALFPQTWRRYERCLKKLGYPSREEADAVRAKRQAQVDEVLRVYACDDCGLWHLTHAPLTPDQIRELTDVLRAELTRFEAAFVQLQQLSRPYARFHHMERKTPREVDEDFARQVDALERLMQSWLAMHQRAHALNLAYATSAETARAIDRTGLKILQESVRLYEEDYDSCLMLYKLYRHAADRAMNTVFQLPAFDWRKS